jgi:hypothetical protein
MYDDSYIFRLISNSVRFGYGKRTVDGRMHHHARHLLNTNVLYE